jgi:TRAP-type C4-dicarboxylate transport system permease large subunit
VVLSVFVYREMGARGLYSALLDTGRLAAVALFCIGTAERLRLASGVLQDPAGAAGQRHQLGPGPDRRRHVHRLRVPGGGLLPRRHPAIIIVGTVLEPLAKSVDMHPVHFAIVSIVSLAFGLVTPPYGLCLMISCAVAGVRPALCAEGHHDHAGADASGSGAMIVWPDIALFLPRLIAPDLLKYVRSRQPTGTLALRLAMR